MGMIFGFSEKHFVQVLIRVYGAAFNIHRIFWGVKKQNHKWQHFNGLKS